MTFLLLVLCGVQAEVVASGQICTGVNKTCEDDHSCLEINMNTCRATSGKCTCVRHTPCGSRRGTLTMEGPKTLEDCLVACKKLSDDCTHVAYMAPESFLCILYILNDDPIDPCCYSKELGFEKSDARCIESTTTKPQVGIQSTTTNPPVLISSTSTASVSTSSVPNSTVSTDEDNLISSNPNTDLSTTGAVEKSEPGTGLDPILVIVVVVAGSTCVLLVVFCALIQYCYRASSEKTPPKFIRWMVLSKSKDDQQPPNQYTTGLTDAPLEQRGGGYAYRKKRDLMAFDSTLYSGMHQFSDFSSPTRTDRKNTSFSDFSSPTRTDRKNTASTDPSTAPMESFHPGLVEPPPPPPPREPRTKTARTLRKIQETAYFDQVADLHGIGK